MSLLDDLMQNAEEISDGYNNYRDLIQQPENTDVVIPKGITVISDYAFYKKQFKSITFPDTLTTIESYAFTNSSLSGELELSAKLIGTLAFQNIGITKAIFKSGVENIEYGSFSHCDNLIEVVLPNTIKKIYQCFEGSGIKTINLPASLENVYGAVSGCTRLENVTIENGFNCNSLNLSSSTLYSAATIVSWLNALADRTGETAYTLTIGSTNLAKLTAEQIAIATDKNWNLA